ncbi:Murein DD-endopeptidase MepM and murein hydrolase activator NlpD, contain LysM domain [Cohaesibacter marisflavi]|uniref:Murein DD-endopeptidase MepM and murein hydrolase activator NlpD, contain LysM domain n=2 Tax=Cohaesibacter marisflavi TaxID=655353 RepID=A0A1I5GIX1_9HYPH|nr:Murein DD-endopeptidase MepM and murein hydrolase activator NlpD, contain LysM domain [Cohaesibacter marisflavi]
MSTTSLPQAPYQKAPQKRLQASERLSSKISLGQMPALLSPSARLNPPDRRTLNIRWLVGTVLTGCTSIFLMGGALVAGIQSQDKMTEQAFYQQTEQDRELAPGELITAGTKGNRLSRSIRPVSHRREIQVSTISTLGDENLVTTKPFMLISASLETKKSLNVNFPAFDPVRIFSSSAEKKPQTSNLQDDQLYSANVEGEMRLRSEPLNLVSNYKLDAGRPSNFEIRRLVDQSALFLSADNDPTEPAFGVIDPGRFEFPATSVDVMAPSYIRIVPENMSSITKTELNGQGTETEEKIVVAVQGDTVRNLLLENEATEEEAANLADLFANKAGIEALSNNQRMRIVYQLVHDGIRERKPLRISLYLGEEHQITVARSDQGTFQVADEPVESTLSLSAAAENLTNLQSGPRLSVYESVYQTALNNGIAPEMIDEMIKIMSFDVDFNAKVKPGDSLQLFHSVPEDGDAEKAEIMFIEIQLNGETKRYYRYRTQDDGIVDYYDENGRSAKKFLMRKPAPGAKFRSPFGWRRHPILKIMRLHKGVDWSAPRGTPILASGNGRLITRKWSSGYGKFIQIQHTNGYATGYAHMTRFEPGLEVGDYVHQGQIIGYVGSTGLSTGPHLHYEVTVNGRHVDPMRIRLPRGRTLSGDMLASFTQERERINDLLGKPSEVQVAQNDTD